jgi:hypothetical protein
MARSGRFVLAALDGDAAASVEKCASTVGRLLDLPVRSVHVQTGPGLRGEARRSQLARVMRGELQELTGRPEDMLARLVQIPDCSVAVFAIRRPKPGERLRRGSGTALSVARRVNRAMLMVPPGSTDWSGPHRALVVLDGTGTTAMATAEALSPWSPLVEGVLMHAVDDDPAEPASRARQILTHRKRHDCDLIVMSWTRQMRGLSGAAVVDVLAETPVPVMLVVPHETEWSEAATPGP